MQFVILAQKEISSKPGSAGRNRHDISVHFRSKCGKISEMLAGRNRQDMCIFFVLNVENTRNAFYKTRAVHNSCWIGNIDRSSCAGRNRQDMCIFFVLNVENTRNAFFKTRAVHNSCSIWNIDRC